MDYGRVGLVLRALRRRRGWRQSDLAEQAGVSQSSVSRVELGHLGALSVRQLRSLFSSVDARTELDVRWRGGDLDRLVDELHARLGLEVVPDIRGYGWDVASEVTFTRLGDRGSFDLLATRPADQMAAQFELKTEITSAEETQRRFDLKRRFVASVVEERYGWRPRAIGSFFVLTDTSRNRRRVEFLANILGGPEALSTREVRQWLREPAGSPFGFWFVRLSHARSAKCSAGGSHRIRKPREAI